MDIIVVIRQGLLEISNNGLSYFIPLSDLREYAHLRPKTVRYLYSSITDNTLDIITQMNPELLLCNPGTEACVKLHNALQSKMDTMQLTWSPKLIVTPDSTAEYSVSTGNYINFPYDIAKKILIMVSYPQIVEYAYSRMSGGQYDSVTLVCAGCIPQNMITNRLKIFNATKQQIPRVLRDCRATVLTFCWYGRSDINIEFNGELSETLMAVIPRMNNELQSILEQRRADFNNRRFKRTKAIMSQ